MENPNFRNITTETPLTIKGPRGDVILKPAKAVRGEGQQKWCLKIEGVIREKMAFGDQCEFAFPGGMALGNFSSCKETNVPGGYVATFQTIISDPSFWE